MTHEMGVGNVFSNSGKPPSHAVTLISGWKPSSLYDQFIFRSRTQSYKLSVRIVSTVDIYLDMEGEAGAEAGREEGEENEDSLRCVGGPPVLQSGVIRAW